VSGSSVPSAAKLSEMSVNNLKAFANRRGIDIK
jgi:predicted HTH domain antitoxin